MPGLVISLPPDYRHVPPGHRHIPYGQFKKNWDRWDGKGTGIGIMIGGQSIGGPKGLPRRIGMRIWEGTTKTRQMAGGRPSRAWRRGDKWDNGGPPGHRGQGDSGDDGGPPGHRGKGDK